MRLGVRLVFFDLDGTITRHDTLVPYVFGFLARRPWRLLRLLLVIPALIRFALRLSDHGKLKESLIKATLRGHTRAEIAAWTERFVPALLEHGVFADALEAIAAHRRDGDVLVLMSASPDLYVPAIAQRLGFSDVVCTGVQWNGDRLVGALTTANRRGTEKSRCFKELCMRYPGLPTVAYANGPGDLEHLGLADHAVLVNGLAWTRRKAARAGISCTTWR